MTVDQEHTTPAAQLFESKLRPPASVPASVPRTDLVDRLDSAADVPITSVVAPAGYGKTTLLTEWSLREASRFAWLSIDRHDNDLALLLAYTIAALERVAPVDPELVKPRASRPTVVAAARQITSVIADAGRPLVLVLDHVEALDNPDCLDTIAEVAMHVPAGSRVALATRREPPLPVARLRGQGQLIEVGATDLAMSPEEARTLLQSVGIQPSNTAVEMVIERSEGWPVALYLAGLALKAGASEHDVSAAISGDDRFVADYLRSELLARLGDDELTFLSRSAVLDRLSGGLCDAVLETTGSDKRLAALADANLLLVPLDRQGQWYRYHHLFRDLLLTELKRREPQQIAGLHSRAATWYEAHALPAIAIDHALAGGDPEQVNQLLVTWGRAVYGWGAMAPVQRSLEWLDQQRLAEQYPAAATLGALFYGTTGDPAAAERWAHAAEHTTNTARAAPDRVLPDGSTVASWLATVRLMQCRHGPAAMRHDAELAVRELGAGSRGRCTALIGLAYSYVMEGDDDAAYPIVARAVDVGLTTVALPAILVALAMKSWLAANRGEWDDADACAQRALSLIGENLLENYGESAMAYVVSARLALHRGDIAAADDAAARAARIRPRLTYAHPWLSAATLIELAGFYLSRGDASGAREVLRQTRDILQQRPSLGVLTDRCADLSARLDALGSGGVGASSLTTAELRLVPFLPTHLTFPPIGERLFVSRNTVKAQAISIYQKLGVSSRGEAVQRLSAIGMIED